MDPIYAMGEIVLADGRRLPAIVTKSTGGEVVRAWAKATGDLPPDLDKLLGQDVEQLLRRLVASWDEQDRAMRRFFGL